MNRGRRLPNFTTKETNFFTRKKQMDTMSRISVKNLDNACLFACCIDTRWDIFVVLLKLVKLFFFFCVIIWSEFQSWISWHLTYFVFFCALYTLVSTKQNQITQGALSSCVSFIKRKVIVIIFTSLFTKLPWPGDNEVIFRCFESIWHLPTCLPQTVEASHCPLYYWKSSKKLEIPIFLSLAWGSNSRNW